MEALGRDQPGNPQRGAVEDRQDVDRDGSREHQPGMPATQPIAQRGVGVGGLEVVRRRHRTLAVS